MCYYDKESGYILESMRICDSQSENIVNIQRQQWIMIC